MENDDSKISDLLERFHNFDDSMIRKVNITFRKSPKEPWAEIALSCRDMHSLPEGEWVNVVIEILDLIEFNISEASKECLQVLSSGLHIMKSEGVFLFDFGYLGDTPESSSEYRDSKFYFAAANFDWSVRAYEE